MRILKLFILFVTIVFPSISYADDSRLDNCLQYKSQIQEYLESENVSKDYFYLAVCESRCNIKTSSKGARGFFQLMPSTFNSFKDENCTNIDDIKCNTIAAARYIKHLQKRFKKMSILIKAYNRGGTNLIRKGSTSEADGLSRCVMQYVNRKS